MAVPKRKTGRARTHARRSENDKIAAPSRSLCPECGEVKLPHRVCRTAASTEPRSHRDRIAACGLAESDLAS